MNYKGFVKTLLSELDEKDIYYNLFPCIYISEDNRESEGKPFHHRIRRISDLIYNFTIKIDEKSDFEPIFNLSSNGILIKSFNIDELENLGEGVYKFPFFTDIEEPLIQFISMYSILKIDSNIPFYISYDHAMINKIEKFHDNCKKFFDGKMGDILYSIGNTDIIFRSDGVIHGFF